MSGRLHLLRGFVQWTDRRTGRPIRTIDEAEAWVRYIADQGFEHFFTWSSRMPRREAEMAGGSVYFVAKRRALFRLPFLHVDPDESGCAIVMRPELIRVEQRAVGFVRGWRYLAAADAPPDLSAPRAHGNGAAPPAMARELREMCLD